MNAVKPIKIDSGHYLLSCKGYRVFEITKASDIFSAHWYTGQWFINDYRGNVLEFFPNMKSGVEWLNSQIALGTLSNYATL